MRKVRSFLTVAVLALSVFLCGCSDIRLLAMTMRETASADAVSADPSSAADIKAQSIIDELGLGGTMTKLKDRNMRALVFQGNEIYSDGAIYLSSQGKADTVGVFFVTDIEQSRQCIKEYVASLQTETSQFNSTEIFKISNAVTADNGTDMIVLIICSDIEEARVIAAEETGG